MPNQRDPNKKPVKVWLTEQEKEALKQEAERRGYSTLTEFLRDVARGVLKLWILGWIIASLFHLTDKPALEAVAHGGFNMIQLTWTAVACSLEIGVQVVAAVLN